MKITESWLQSAEEIMRVHPKGTHAVFVDGRTEGAWSLDAERLSDLIRLARLGLWAEEQAIPKFRDIESWCPDSPETCRIAECKFARDALAALPPTPGGEPAPPTQDVSQRLSDSEKGRD